MLKLYSFFIPLCLAATMGACGGSNEGPVPTNIPSTTPLAPTAPPSPTAPFAINSSPIMTATVGQAYQYVVNTNASSQTTVKYTLSGAPVGMTIIANTGDITWTPTSGQAGAVTVTVLANSSSGATTEQVFNINIATAPFTYQGFFVAPNGNDANPGTPQLPFLTLNRACKVGAIAGDTIYVRGGTYTNKGFGTGKNNGSLDILTCAGNATTPITFKPFGNEHVKLKFDGFTGIRINGNYTVFEGFEVEGMAQKITYQQALADWWIGSKYFNGNGIVIKAHHVTVRNNIIHDTPGAGIFSDSFGDYTIINNNIIYNAAWWSTKGTHAIGVISTSSFDGSTTQNVKVTGNLIFSSESRIISRVTSKGFAQMSIDEGSGTLFQINAGNYLGGYLLRDNFYLYTGKGIAISSGGVSVENNSLYHTGSTISGRFAGLRINAKNLGNVNVFKNAVHAALGKDAWSMSTLSTVTATGNYFVGNDKPANIPMGNTLVTQVFNAPNQLDFSLATGVFMGVGASISTWQTLKAKCDEYGIVIQPTGWIVDLAGQTQRVAQHPPQGATVDYSNFPLTLNVSLPSKHPIAVANANPDFQLRIDAPFAPTIPSAPVLTSAQAGVGQVVLNWSTVTGAVQYDVLYTNLPVSPSGKVSGADTRVNNVTSGAVIAGLVTGSSYQFAVVAIDAKGLSSVVSNVLTAIPL